MASFEGKVVAISGGSSGMGLALSQLLASRGAKISICDIVQSNLDKAVDQIPTKDLLTFKCDVRKSSEVNEWISKTVEKFGQLDCAANMAGIAGKNLGRAWLHEQDEDEWEKIMGINVTGVMNTMKAEINAMKPGSSIVNAASVAGLIGMPGHAAYCASKHAVVALTRVCARDYGARGIRINAIAPGCIDTPMMDEIKKGHEEHVAKYALSMPIARMGQPEELARVIAFLLSDEASFVTGSIYTADGGWTDY